MTRWLTALLAAGLFHTPAIAADPAPVRLVIKPLLCVLDKTATTCSVTLDIRWKSTQPADYCLADSVSPDPQRCWERCCVRRWRDLRLAALPPRRAMDSSSVLDGWHA